MGKRPPRPEDMLKHPKLDRQVKVRLLYQSPEIYATDVASEKPYIGPDYGCFRADQDGKGEMGFMHPEITFNALPPIFGGIQEVHVHLEDTTSNLVFWDADFKLPMLDPVVNLVGKTRLKKFAMPKSMMDKFYKLCVPKDDIRPHFFDLSVRTIGKYWDEDLKEFRPNKGFARGRSPEAHIGFTVQRMPSLDFEGKEKPGKWKKPGSSYANNAPVLQDPHDQLMHGHVDPFYDAMKGKTYRGYYDFIIERGGRTKDKYEYLAKYGPPPFLTDPPGWEDFEVKQKAF